MRETFEQEIPPDIPPLDCVAEDLSEEETKRWLEEHGEDPCDQPESDDPWRKLVEDKALVTHFMKRDPALAAELLQKLCAEAEELMKRPGAEIKPSEACILWLIELVRVLLNSILRALGMREMQIPDFGVRQALAPMQFKSAVEEVTQDPIERLMALLEGVRLGSAEVSRNDVVSAVTAIKLDLTADDQRQLQDWIDRYGSEPSEAATAIQALIGGAFFERAEAETYRGSHRRER